MLLVSLTPTRDYSGPLLGTTEKVFKDFWKTFEKAEPEF